MKQKKTYFPVHVFVIFLFFVSCGNSIEEAKEASDNQFDLIERGKGIEMLQTEDGKPKIKITAPETVRHLGSEPYTEFPEGMTIYVYNEIGELENKLTAEKGKTADHSEDVEVQGNVHIINEKGDVMKTDKLVWDKKKKKLISEDRVEIHTNDEIIYGTGFEANEDFSSYTIHNISGTVKIKDQGNLQ